MMAWERLLDDLWPTGGVQFSQSSLGMPFAHLTVCEKEREEEGEMSSFNCLCNFSNTKSICVPLIFSYNKLDSPHHEKKHKSPKKKYPKQLNKLLSLPKHPSLEHSNCCMCGFRNRTQIKQRECEKECKV